MKKHLDLAIESARKAGKIIRTYSAEGFEHWHKDEGSVVTDADVASEKFLLGALEDTHLPIVSEEQYPEVPNAEAFWVIDPLDGTFDFAQGDDHYTVLIGLVEHGEPTLGVIFQPATDILYYATKGDGAYMQVGESDPVRIRVSKNANTENLKVVLSPRAKGNALVESLKAHEIGYMGGFGIRVAKIAEGVFDCLVDTKGSICVWDTAAPEIILKEAGGMLTDEHGNQTAYNSQQACHLGVIASNSELHEFLIGHVHTNKF